MRGTGCVPHHKHSKIINTENLLSSFMKIFESLTKNTLMLSFKIWAKKDLFIYSCKNYYVEKIIVQNILPRYINVLKGYEL